MTRAIKQLSDVAYGAGACVAPARSYRAPGAAVLAVFTVTLFLSSTLLFLVQPMFARLVLPLLGGTPAVWNTCMVFFQACLLAGYAYSHLATRWLGARKHAVAHLFVLLLPLVVLPLKVPAGWVPPATGNPTGWLLMLLTATVGLPFFVVSTTGPLVQKWFATTGHRSAGDPYFLYAASNLGSMLALLGYPLVVEPLLRLNQQTTWWTAGYALLCVALVACSVAVWRAPSANVIGTPQLPEATPTLRQRARWILLALVPSSYLLGVTTFVTTDIAAAPLLWVLPLALYLLTFILVFLKRPLVSQHLMMRLLPPLVLGVGLLLLARAVQPIGLVLGLHLLTFFVVAMVCHGELARSRPPAEHLTDFYLMMSVGGVLGGLFNALLAPMLFTSTIEYPIAIVLGCLLWPGKPGVARPPTGKVRVIDLCLPLAVAISAWGLPKWIGVSGGPLFMLSGGVPVILCMLAIRRRTRFALGVTALLAVASLGGSTHGRLLHAHRSFFGVHRIFQSGDGQFTELYHGSTIHGRQRTGSGESLAYYHRTGPVGQFASRLLKDPLVPRKIGVVGLGVGSLAAYARPTTHLTYYEIDPAVLWAAQDSQHFSFLHDARQRGATVEVVLGDARLTLRSASPAQFDLLVLDAFSGDAVPVHLLTRQAMAIYLEKIKPEGLLAIHISNLYLDLKPVVAALAKDAGCTYIAVDDLDLNEADRAAGKSASQWMLVGRSPAALEQAMRNPPAGWAISHPLPTAVWTDDYSNILSVFRWR